MKQWTKLSFKYRIAGAFGGLFALILGVILIFTYKWITNRAEEYADLRLKQSAEVLKRIHKMAADERARQFQNLAVEPRFRALAEIQDRDTLEYAAREVRTALDYAAFAFLSSSGEVLAWDGVGRQELEDSISSLVTSHEGNMAELFVINHDVLEITKIGMRQGNTAKGYIIAARVIDSGILDDYSIAVNAKIELRMNHRILAASQSIRTSDKKFSSLTVSLKGPLHFIVKLDTESITAPFFETFRTLVYISVLGILLGGMIFLGIADRFARPVQDLATVTKTVGEGDMSVRATATGAPEFKVLSHNFNQMIESLCNYQNKLKEHADQLEDEVQERIKHARFLDREINDHKETMGKLHEAVASAEAATRAKSEFLANMSHELRTPLHGILSFAKFGIKNHATAASEKVLGYFEKIQYSGQVLLALLNDLLDLSKLESGTVVFDFQRTDMNALIASVTDEFTALLSEKKLTIEFPKPELKNELNVDLQKIKQVFRNLLGNAVKFSTDGGSIKVTSSRDNGCVKVSVYDQGIGIPEDEFEAVFDKFIQSSKTKTGAGGTGLGLSICKEIIHAHNGRIWAESNLDGGTIFSFQIPCELEIPEPNIGM